MEDFYGKFSTGRRVSQENEDLEEEDVWATPIMTTKESSFLNYSKTKTRKNLSSVSPPSSSSSAPRSIPKSINQGFLANQRSSAPVDIPDWSKILKKNSPQKKWDFDECDQYCDNDDEDMVPPHEYLARRLASTKIASFSMCEGVGRTLKGRDLSKMRNAILTKTGFLE